MQQEKQIAKSDLLRKCGLLAHTSPTFLKNCWIKKLLVACGSFLTTNIIFTAMLKPLQKKAPDITLTPIRTESNLLHAAP
ncbi:MAG: hypothetical protein MR378_07950, partial [Ruminococcus sp.]|nr:hypothetical protein [Ruminococcus sp.]